MIRSTLLVGCILVLVIPAVAGEPQNPLLAGTTALLVYQLAGPSVGAAPSSLGDNPKIEGYHVLDLRVVTNRDKVKQVLAVVASQLKIDGNPAACFQPGMAIGFLGPSGVTNVLVCLDCDNISVPGNNRLVGISEDASRALTSFYAEMFHNAR